MNAPADFLMPPHSIESEQSVLGGLLLDQRAWDIVSDVLTDADFYTDSHRRIWRHIAQSCMRGQPVDVVTIAESIEAAGESSATGGLAYLGELANSTPSTANIKRYAEIVRERSTLRRLQSVGVALQAECANASGRSAADIAAAAEAAIVGALDCSSGDPESLSDVLGDVLRYVDDRGDAGGQTLGFRDVDAMIGGLEPGNLMIVAARPSVGKTMWGCNVADHVATAGGAVLFHTLEMSRREVGMRIMSARSGVSVKAMRSGTKDGEHWGRMSGQMPAAAQQRMLIDDAAAVTVGQVRAKARRMQRKTGLSLVVIDYLQLMRGDGDNRTQEMGSISRGLKALAKELQVPIIALAQLNRGVEGRADKRPLLSDLRDSGEIEQDADIVAMLHREELYSDGPQWVGVAEMIIRKNRNGPTGEVLLTYQPECMRFANHCGQHPRQAVARSSGRGGYTRPGGLD
jgi:replicative DNA helicase